MDFPVQAFLRRKNSGCVLWAPCAVTESKTAGCGATPAAEWIKRNGSDHPCIPADGGVLKTTLLDEWMVVIFIVPPLLILER
jgi:hypothetical protein